MNRNTSSNNLFQQQQQQQQMQVPQSHQPTPIGTPRVLRGSMRKQNAISVTLTPDLHENLAKLCEAAQAQGANVNVSLVNHSSVTNELITIERKLSSVLAPAINSQAANATASQSNLNIDSQQLQQQHLKSRKSLIGSRLERSSFQTQRLSDVSVAFGQQITAKMGLKLPASQERIVEQTRKLYLKYLFVKLRQNSLPLRDLNLTKSSRARRANNSISRQSATGKLINSDMVNVTDCLPKIVCSAPASAIPLEDSDSKPFNLINNNTAPAGSEQQKHYFNNTRRRATAVGQNFDTQELSLLATKLKNSISSTFAQANKITFNESSTHTSGSKLTNNLSGSSASLNQVGGGDSKSDCLFAATTAAASVPKRYLMNTTINNQIFVVILKIIAEFRELKPDYYGDTIYEHIGIDKFSSLDSLLNVQMTICQELTRSEISWCRICSMFSLIGSMSLDCVRLGAPEHVGPLLDGFIDFVEKDLALWISQQGGWESFLYKYRASYNFNQLKSLTLFTLLVPISLWAFAKLVW